MRLPDLQHPGRRRIFRSLLLLCAAASVFPISKATGQFSRETPAVLAVRKVGPAVVNINTEEVIVRQSPFPGLPGFFPPEFEQFFRGFDAPRRRKRQSLGSGVIIDPKGFILTNEHVIRRATSIRVSLIDRREFEAEVIGADSRSDLAVIRIKAKKPLPYVTMGQSEDLMPGETVIAIGNPFGLGHTVTTGIISGVHRAMRLKGGIQTDFIQTDAAINPGNSGGPLLNINGGLIGINTAIRAQAEGIGFAVPIDRVKRIVNHLIRFGEIQPGWTGLIVRDLTEPIRDQFGYSHRFGVFISRVLEKSAASRAGIQPGMILMRIVSKTVESREEFPVRHGGVYAGLGDVAGAVLEGEGHPAYGGRRGSERGGGGHGGAGLARHRRAGSDGGAPFAVQDSRGGRGGHRPDVRPRSGGPGGVSQRGRRDPEDQQPAHQDLQGFSGGHRRGSVFAGRCPPHPARPPPGIRHRPVEGVTWVQRAPAHGWAGPCLRGTRLVCTNGSSSGGCPYRPGSFGLMKPRKR